MPTWVTQILPMEAVPGKKWPRPGKSHPVGARVVVFPSLTGGRIIRVLFLRYDLRSGSPTGNLLIEDHTLGLAGTYLVACMVRKEVMSVTPEWKNAQIEMGQQQPFISLKEDRRENSLPTRFGTAPDGSLFFLIFTMIPVGEPIR